MIRVMMLAPFLIVLGLFVKRSPTLDTAAPRGRVPAFALAFIFIAIVHPYLGLSPDVITVFQTLDVILLAAAMAALGLDTTLARLRLAGRDSLLLGAILFGYLIVGGGLANWLIERALSLRGPA
jgi:uncharacterized integral membrane protein (TIGR00698 family)